jgi:CTP synthase (UTP-ammonia lyase)
MTHIALVGDHDPGITAHTAIRRALSMARAAVDVPLEWTWLATDGLDARALAGFSGIWVVPGSPYRDMDGALAAIRFARENDVPFLGTCGGFQHALVEIARNVAGIAKADHAESNATAEDLVVVPLACSLVEKSGGVTFTVGSRLAAIFGGRPATEGYHCSYGLNAAYRARLEAAGLRFTGFDEAGDVRAVELPSHRFFVGTLFQPERAALREERHPLVEAFVRSAASAAVTTSAPTK